MKSVLEDINVRCVIVHTYAESVNNYSSRHYIACTVGALS